jgi:hypothetical protein
MMLLASRHWTTIHTLDCRLDKLIIFRWQQLMILESLAQHPLVWLLRLFLKSCNHHCFHNLQRLQFRLLHRHRHLMEVLQLVAMFLSGIMGRWLAIWLRKHLKRIVICLLIWHLVSFTDLKFLQLILLVKESGQTLLDSTLLQNLLTPFSLLCRAKEKIKLF